MSQQNTKTPAMVLQEFTVKHHLAPPEYVLAHSRMGTHENEFHYEVNVASVLGKGFGRSKQVAKHDAATKALEILADKGLYDPNTDPAQDFNAQSHRNESDSPLKPQVNFIGSLNELSFLNKMPYAQFMEISDVGPPHSREFTYECRLGSITTQSTAKTKKQAKQLAARDMFYKVRDICPLLSEQFAAEANALTDRDQEAMKRYVELSATLDVLPNKAVTVDEFTSTLQNIMTEKNLTNSNFREQFHRRDQEGLDHIFNLLEVNYKFDFLQEDPPIACALFGLDTPFNVIAVGSNKESAQVNLISQLYSVLEAYMDYSDDT